MQNNNNKEPQKKKARRRFDIVFILVVIILIIAIFFLIRGFTTKNPENLDYQTFVTALKNGMVTDTINATPVGGDNYLMYGLSGTYINAQGNKVSFSINVTSTLLEELIKDNAGYKFYIVPASNNYWLSILISFLPYIIMGVIFFFLFRGIMKSQGGAGGAFDFAKSTAKLSRGKSVTFKDVAGCDEEKEEMVEIVDFLKNPRKYNEIGARVPKGVILVGPPGTGKTLLAKAVAGEANVPFFSMSGSDFVEMFVGVGASRVRDLFRQAKEKSPAIIFIDEIDAIGRARGRNNAMGGGNDERESTLNQLLTEMDGFGTNSGVIILAATNRADVLDSALLRAGRFDRQIHVELPDLQERKEIFGVHLAPIKLDNTIDINFLAKQTPGFSGADIANVCNEAALIAARKDHKKVTKQDFMDAVDRIIGGLERKNKVMTEEEKCSVAYHEAGHATISWLLRYGNPLVKVTIVPRGMALGAAWYLPEERQLTNKDHIMDNLCSLLGGRAAEEVFLKQTSTGALNDLERATKQAYAMVAYYGMSDKLKNLSYYDSTGRYDMGITKPYSEKTAEVIDAETAAIIAEQMARAKKILEENAEGHNKLAELLIEKEVITSDDVEAILGARPWTSRTDEIIEANEASKANEAKGEKKKRAPRKKKEEMAPIAENTISTSNSEQSEQSDSDSGLTSNSETI